MKSALTTIHSDTLTAQISVTGAELQRLTTHDGCDLLWNGDPQLWTGKAPILFPVVGALLNGCYRLDGKFYAMPKHGFARHSEFELVESAAHAATFRLTASELTRPIYPFEFELEIRFSLEGANLAVTASITNASDKAMPASFGFHPAFCWPLPFGQPRDDHTIAFECGEAVAVRRIAPNGLLLEQTFPSPVVGKTLTLRDDLFIADAIIFDELSSRCVTYGASAGRKLVINYAEFPTLGVWTKPGSGFICIEPWQGFADPVGFVGDIRDKPGIIEIAPGGCRTFAMHISLED